MRTRHLLTAVVLIATVSPGVRAVPTESATFTKAELGEQFLLQISYEQTNGRQDFRTSRSRIVTFHREGGVLKMIDASDSREAAASHALASIPVRNETSESLDLGMCHLVVMVEEHAPLTIAACRRLTCRVDDVAEQHGRERPVHVDREA